MEGLAGFYSYSHCFSNQDVNTKGAEEVSEALKGATQLSKDEQEKVLNNFLGQSEFTAQKGKNDADYFTLTQNGETACFRVLEKNGQQSIVMTTFDENGVGQTAVFDVTYTNDIDDWDNDENITKLSTSTSDISFKMFEYDKSTYVSDLTQFAQSHLDKYDNDKDKSLNSDEFTSMLTQGATISDADKSLYNNLLNDWDLNKDGSLNAEEYAAYLMFSDKYGQESPDGKLSLRSYNTLKFASQGEDGQTFLQGLETLYNIVNPKTGEV